jgi:hypothetical protein
VYPEGLYLIPLPYADDLRQIEALKEAAALPPPANQQHFDELVAQVGWRCWCCCSQGAAVAAAARGSVLVSPPSDVHAAGSAALVGSLPYPRAATPLAAQAEALVEAADLGCEWYSGLCADPTIARHYQVCMCVCGRGGECKSRAPEGGASLPHP